MMVKNNFALYIVTILLTIFTNLEYCSSLRILGIFPLNGKSHWVMCERLMKGLAERGHEVDVYSHFPLRKSVPNYNDFSLEGSLPAILNNMSYDFFNNFRSPNMEKMIESVGNPVCELMNLPVFQDLFQNLKKNQPYDVVIIETFISNCYLAWGRHLNIPMVGVMTSSLIDFYNEPLGNPINLAVTQCVWSGLLHPMNFWERLSNTFLYYMINGMYKYHMSVQNQAVEKFFGSGYPDIIELPKDIDLLLVNTHHAIDGIRAFTPAIIPLAGLHVVDDDTKLPVEVKTWLDESKAGCIYVSFGSMVRIETFPKPILNVFYTTFRNIAPVRVLMKIAKSEELPAGLPSNVMTQPWFSQIQVLKHKNIKAFVTHGGLMSTLESIYAGIPLVGIPLFGDQFINIEAQVRRKTATAVDLENISEETMTYAIKNVLKDVTYKKNIQKLSKELTDRPMDPMETAAFWIEYIVRHGKKSLRSPIVDMPWWQANLIDVYGFIIFILAVIYYVFKVLIRIINHLCCSAKTNHQQMKMKKN